MKITFQDKYQKRYALQMFKRWEVDVIASHGHPETLYGNARLMDVDADGITITTDTDDEFNEESWVRLGWDQFTELSFH